MGRGAGRGALRRVCAARCPRGRIGRKCAVVPRRLGTRTLRLQRQTCRGHFCHFFGRLVERAGWGEIYRAVGVVIWMKCT